MIYLASPYSDPSPGVRELRFVLAREATLKLLQRGSSQVIFSPIVYSHQFANSLGGDFGSWKEFDLSMIDIADEVWVLKLDGWEQSHGVWNEIENAKLNDKPVKYLDPHTLKEDVSHHAQ